MDHITHRAKELIELIELEKSSQYERWEVNTSSMKELRQTGEVMFPLKINKHTFSFDSYPELHLSYPNNYDTRIFSQGSPVILFSENNEQCSASIRSINDQDIELSLNTEDIPLWVSEEKVGIRPQVDEKSFKYMKGILNSLIKGTTNELGDHLHSIYSESKPSDCQNDLEFRNKKLNNSQKHSVRLTLGEGRVVSIQGPPGTGKTTTLVEAIHQHVKINRKVVASAPSNAAVDNLAKRLIQNGLNIVRLGNTAKVDNALWPKTPEGIISAPNYQKEFKKLRAQANELQKKAEQFKRNFTKEDRENRKLWRKEARAIKKEIRELTHYHLSKHIKNADVILGTPIGLCDGLISDINFDVALIDEAGQCLIPMGFLVMDNAEKVILCGDQFQLPPTVIDRKAEKEGLAKSILEEALLDGTPDALLSIQYRMPPQIATFSSNYFYKGMVKSFKKDEGQHLLFYDTAGAGYKEEVSEQGSRHNPEELQIAQKIILQNNINSATFISPYSAQVRAAKKELPEGIKCMTIDGFQGQEDDVIIISLVRNNEEGKIGFLSDYRRMNVALTRSSSMLYIIGDSVTLAGDNFYQSFIDYAESNGAYKSVFELLYE